MTQAITNQSVSGMTFRPRPGVKDDIKREITCGIFAGVRSRKELTDWEKCMATHALYMNSHFIKTPDQEVSAVVAIAEAIKETDKGYLSTGEAMRIIKKAVGR